MIKQMTMAVILPGSGLLGSVGLIILIPLYVLFYAIIPAIVETRPATKALHTETADCGDYSHSIQAITS